MNPLGKTTKHLTALLTTSIAVVSITACSVLTLSIPAFAQDDSKPGVILPDRRPGTFKGTIGETFRDSKADFPISRAAPAGAPNVLLILLDDVGFGATSTFGGPIPTPSLDQLANEGLRYTQWHTTALCSPSRAALITGRNHHEAGFGVISEIATGFPGYSAVMPDTSATMGRILQDNGYNTSWFGKNHNIPDYETSQAGPYTQWANAMGFEYFFGFNGGETNQWAPALTENHSAIEPPTNDPNYHFQTDLTDRAISWMRNQKSIAPKKPFLLYFAPGATHAPHHAPKEWIAKFKGKFDHGWNKVSEDTFNRMKAMNIIPQNAKYNPIPKDVGEWDKLSADQKKVFARMMEVYAGFLAFTDHETGRLLQAVKDLGISENTLIIYGVGDNGASSEGSFSGTLNEVAANFNSHRPNAVTDALKRLDDIGGPTTYNHFPAGWGMAMNSPMKFAKRQASHFGGTRNGLVISWPGHIKDAGSIRTQFAHISDILPTVLEAAGLPQPKVVNGVKQTPMSGISMAYTFNAANAAAPSHRTTQYFEMGGTRAIYHNGWVAATTHGILPWSDERAQVALEDDVWELYDISKDFTEHDDLAAQFPKKLAELKAKFLEEAKAHNVLPLDDRAAERFSAQLSGRPLGPVEGLTEFTYYAGMTRLPEGSAPDIKNKSFTLTAKVEIPKGGAEGVIITQGGLFGGWGLLLDKGKPQFIYNWLQEDITFITAPKALTPGSHDITFVFKYDGNGMGKGGTGSLLVDGKSVVEARIEKTVPNRFSTDETLDVGQDNGTALTTKYKVPYKFTGKIDKVHIQLQ